MKHRLQCYVRAYRMRWGLTERELTYLLGAKSGSLVSRIERGVRRPTISTMLGCQILFGTAPEELFPGFFAEIEDEVIARAQELYEILQGTRSPATKTKLDFLEEVIARAAARNGNV